MKIINLVLSYRDNEEFNNALYESLIKLDKSIQEIDDLFIEDIRITPIEDDEE